jgi:hypothetical protein
MPEAGFVSAGCSKRLEEPTGLGAKNIELAHWRVRILALFGSCTEHHLEQSV